MLLDEEFAEAHHDPPKTGGNPMSPISKGYGRSLFAVLAISCTTPLNGQLAGGRYVDPSGK